ncbi:alpha/beta fold hydrolase [Kocuria sp. M1R5S2]|uniref:alpha/beta fold hydrolase n=1 Tax=Kocuria rhizosphaerae TaxID=3376285 RepID=UPI003787F366
MELTDLGEHRRGDPVVLIHGLTASASSGWVRTGWARDLERAGFRPLGVDLPGHGPRAAPVPAGTSRAGLVEAIRRLLDGVDVPVPVVGYSVGAQLAWSAAARSSRVSSLVLGGLGPRDRLAELGRALAGDPDAHPDARAFAAARTAAAGDPAQVRRWAEFARLLGAEPFAPGREAPAQPALLFAGARDAWADPEQLARCRPLDATTRLLLVPGRDHVDALTAGTARKRAVEFLRRTTAEGGLP